MNLPCGVRDLYSFFGAYVWISEGGQYMDIKVCKPRNYRPLGKESLAGINGGASNTKHSRIFDPAQ